MSPKEDLNSTRTKIAVWRDAGCIGIKTINPRGDPVGLSDDEAVERAETLLRLAGRRR